MALVYVPIRTISLQTASNPGNCYWKKVSFTNWDAQWPAMKPNLESKIWGQVTIPANLSLNATTRNIICDFRASSGAGTSAKMRIGSARIENDPNAPESFDVTFTNETLATVTVPAFGNGALFRWTQSIVTALIPQDGIAPQLIVELFRDGDDAGDTLEADLELTNWYLECEI